MPLVAVSELRNASVASNHTTEFDVTFRSLLVALILFPMSAFAVSIESVTLLADNEGEPGDAVEVFIPSDQVQHFDIQLDAVEAGNHEFLVEFWAVDTTAGENLKVSEFKSSSLITNKITAKVSLPREWPVGLYRLDVKMDGATIGSHEYDVAEPEE
ncbi:MAG: hypothetical protein KA763_06950 [Xanthomonadales bacterium]|nr:hypothetical protein [Xanthomonadales bacterium]